MSKLADSSVAGVGEHIAKAHAGFYHSRRGARWGVAGTERSALINAGGLEFFDALAAPAGSVETWNLFGEKLCFRVRALSLSRASCASVSADVATGLPRITFHGNKGSRFRILREFDRSVLAAREDAKIRIIASSSEQRCGLRSFVA